MTLYPLKFAPRFVEKIWGGHALARVAGKALPAGRAIGESWELCDFPPGAVGADGRQPGDDPEGWTSSRVADGPLAGRSLHEVMLDDPRALLGDAAPVATPHGPQFPLLVKFLDAKQDLSVQVHPPESYARAHPGASVKNECWHVLWHAPGARILIGTKPGTTRDAFAAAIADGTVESLINAVPVRLGDTFYLPSGTVHALGAGIVVAEVQTPSDTTYRVFDFDRVEPGTGKPRALHVAQALDCIDFDADATRNVVGPGTDDAIVTSAPQFTLSRHAAAAGATVAPRVREMRVMIALAGAGAVGDVPFAAGETVLIPAGVEASIRATADARWLEARVRSASGVAAAQALT